MITNNSRKAVTIYNIPDIVKLALPKAINSTNIIFGFQAPGITPFNKDIFTDVDLQAHTSQNNTVKTAQPGTSNTEHIQSQTLQTITKSIPSTSKDISLCLSMLSPQEIHPFPKIG